MLSGLKIENIAVIEHSEIEFGSGLNILTGETGAGKSIVIDAINAVLGERTSKDIIRSGCEKARVTAWFNEIPDSLTDLLLQYDIDNEENSLLISRIISSDGRGSCKVNGCPVTVTMLREIGRRLISICGQHDSQFLLQKDCHLGFIDTIADSEELLSKYKDVYLKTKEVRKKLKGLLRDEDEKERRLDILQYQIDEITQADVRIGERQELVRRRDAIRNIEKISDCVLKCDSLLNGGNDEGGIISLMHNLSACVTELSGYDDSFSVISDSVKDMIYALSDYSSEITSRMLESEYSYSDINEIEERLDLIYRLSKKYGNSEEEILDFLQKAQEEYDSICNSDEIIELLSNELSVLEDELFKTGCYLSDARKSASIDFENKIMRELNYLDMPNARFIVDFKDSAPTENGIDEVEFLFSANAGQEPKSLQKIASGGELSRVMLAIRSVLSDTDIPSTVVFDEIDTGVSGRAAHKIAYKMHELSRVKQVLCVTHLAQIAAYADKHLYIEKHSNNENTYTNVTALDYDSRVCEIARIIGGEVVTNSTLESAKEMIEYAQSGSF